MPTTSNKKMRYTETVIHCPHWMTGDSLSFLGPQDPSKEFKSFSFPFRGGGRGRWSKCPLSQSFSKYGPVDDDWCQSHPEGQSKCRFLVTTHTNLIRIAGVKTRNLPFLFYTKAMAPHSSTLAWKIPWTEEPGRLQSRGSLRVGHD